MKITIDFGEFFNEGIREMVSAAVEAKLNEVVQAVVNEAAQVRAAIDELKQSIVDGTADDDELVARLEDLKSGIENIYTPVSVAVDAIVGDTPTGELPAPEAPVESAEPQVMPDPQVPTKTSDLGQ